MTGSGVNNGVILPTDQGLLVSLPGATDTFNVQAAAPFSLKLATGGRLFVPIANLSGANYVLDIDMIRYGSGPNARAVFEIISGNLSFSATDTLGNHYSAGPVAYSPTTHAFFIFHWDGTNLLLETESSAFAITTRLTVPNMATFIDFFLFVIAFTTGGFAGPSSYVLPELNEADGPVVAIRGATTAHAAALSVLLGWSNVGAGAGLIGDLTRIINDVERTF